MYIHHSRDTAHKQWSETRVLALRGLSRVLRTCTKYLLLEQWFQVMIMLVMMMMMMMIIMIMMMMMMIEMVMVIDIHDV